MKKLIKTAIARLGYRVTRIETPAAVGSAERPIGNMHMLLEDLRHRGLRCSSIVDVGANMAKWSRMAKAVFPEAKIFMMEPQLEMKPLLDAFCTEFPDASYIMAGAGATKSKLTFTVWDDLQGSSFMVEEDSSLKTTGKQREVEVVTINDLIAEGKVTIPAILKLDVQGFELEVLKGAGVIFGKTEVILMEAAFFEFYKGQPVFSDLVNFMLDRGYVVYELLGFSRRPLDGALGQCDICFVKKEGFLRTSNKWTADN